MFVIGLLKKYKKIKMASLSDDENVVSEGTGRRTRSGRAVKAVALPPVPRATRRTRRGAAEPEPVPDPMPELADPEPEPESESEPVPPAEDEKSSSFPFGEMPSDITSLYEQSSADREELNNIAHDSIDNLFFANLAAEENANSLPSGADESEIREEDESKDVQNQIYEVEEEEEEEEIVKLNLEEEPATVNYDKSSGDEIDQEMSNGDQEVIEEDIILNNDDNENSNRTESSDNAIAEDIVNGQDSRESKADPDAEMVSEDELPVPEQPKVQDAEEVSDDELPGPKLAELPADTEVVSEDELPSSAKMKRRLDEGYDPGSPTESAEGPEKKVKIDPEPEDPEKDKKKLPDLDKYWKAVNDDPADFTAWTYLLQYVDQENDIEAAREAYDAFLAHYPYCYGYWRKYADYEKRKGNKKKCEEVFERGLKAIPLSVDLWIHYLTHVKTNYGEDEEFIRSQFERALAACGLEFRSDKLWEAYIKWETEAKRISNIVNIYDRLLTTPTQGYNGHFDSFQEIVNNNPVQSLISVEELKSLRAEVRESTGEIKEESKEEVSDEPPGEDEADDHIKNEEEGQGIKDKILAVRRKLHKATVAAVTARWVYEEAIKRPYFHVKPLERCQLKNWKDYLDYEIEQDDRKRILVLFERCLIACALYDEFWLKLIRYLESQNDPELISNTRDAFERACTVHHPDKPSLHLMWSAFEECQNNCTKAAEILTNLEKVCPNLLQVAYRRINLERRRNDYPKCVQLYEYYITTAKNKNIATSLAIKYARFCHKIKSDLSSGIEILKAALEKDPTNARIALQLIDFALQRETVDETEVVEIMDNFMAREGMEPDQKVLFAQRKVEFLEDFGSTAKGLQDAQRLLQIALNKANEAKKKASEQSPTSKKSSKDTQPPLPTSGTTNTSNYGSYNYNSSGQTPANYYGSNVTQSNYGSYGDSNYGYNQWSQYTAATQPGYSGYGQWSGYGNYY